MKKYVAFSVQGNAAFLGLRPHGYEGAWGTFEELLENCHGDCYVFEITDDGLTFLPEKTHEQHSDRFNKIAQQQFAKYLESTQK